MAILALFLLGIGNFALHKAVLARGHAVLRQVPAHLRTLSGRATLATEFLALLAAMLVVNAGWLWGLWVYSAYSALNMSAAWLILTDRM